MESPEFIIQGYKNALIAMKHYGSRGYLGVVYKEISKDDGFIITAYFTQKLDLSKSVIIWQKK
jgi:hypothetical protein